MKPERGRVRDAGDRNLLQQPQPRAAGGEPLELYSIPDHEGFRQASRKSELLSLESASPVAFSFGGLDRIPSVPNTLIHGETVFGAAVPDWVLERQPYEPLPVYGVRFTECRVFPTWGALMPSAGGIFEPSVRAARWKSPDLTQLPGITLVDGRPVVEAERLPETRLDGLHLLLNHWGGANYGHFLFDCVPGVMMFHKELLLGEVKILTGPLKPWQQELLGLLDIPPEAVTSVPVDSCVSAGLLWPSFLQGNLNRPAAFTRFAAEYLRRPGAAAGPELIYVSRANFPNRKMANEAELIAALTELGFSVVRPEELPVERQIRLFSNARVVIGEVGAALANLLFAPAACKVLEIMPEIKQNLWIKRWCGLRGMEWYCVYAAVPPSGRKTNVVDGVKYHNLYFSYDVSVQDVVAAARHALRA